MPKKTTEVIIESGNDYVIQVKGNQKKLLNACKTIASQDDLIDVFQTQEKSRGRYEIRNVKVYAATDLIPVGWKELKRIIKVERLTERNGKAKYSESYYISSLTTKSAREFSEGIRGHWAIENKLHWVKDVIQNEDKSRIKKGNGIENLSILKNFAINICRILGFTSIKYAAILYASNAKKLYNEIRT